MFHDVKELIKSIKGTPESSSMIAEVVLECMRRNKSVHIQWQCLKIMWENCKEEKATVMAFISLKASSDILCAMNEHKDELKVMKNEHPAFFPPNRTIL